MSEERLQEIKDSVEFQYKLAKVKCIDNALLFTNEEEELIEEIERLKEQLEYTIPIVEHNKTITKHLKEIERLNRGLDELEELCKTKYYEKNTTDIDSIAIAGNLYVYMYKKIKELKGSDKE